MNVFLSLWVLFVCLICMTQAASKRNKICYKAKTCIHNGVDKCGVDGSGNLRRFFDSCDILEFNCLKGNDYVKTAMDKCSSLPPIEDALTHKNHKLVEEKTHNKDHKSLDDQEFVHDQEEPEGQESLIDQEASEVQESLNDQEAPEVQESLNDEEAPEVQESLNDQEAPEVQESLNDEEAPEVQESLNDQEAPEVQESVIDQEAPHDPESLNDSGSENENQVTSNRDEEVHELEDQETVKNDELQKDEEVPTN